MRIVWTIKMKDMTWITLKIDVIVAVVHLLILIVIGIATSVTFSNTIMKKSATTTLYDMWFTYDCQIWWSHVNISIHNGNAERRDIATINTTLEYLFQKYGAHGSLSWSFCRMASNDFYSKENPHNLFVVVMSARVSSTILFFDAKTFVWKVKYQSLY